MGGSRAIVADDPKEAIGDWKTRSILFIQNRIDPSFRRYLDVIGSDLMMYSLDPKKRRRVRKRPQVEGLESRELLSYGALLAAVNRTPAITQAAFSNAAAQSAYMSNIHQNVSSVQVGPNGITPFATAIQYALHKLYPPGDPQPLPHEVVRQSLVVKITGEYIVGPPRFSDQSFQIAIKAQGTSNQSFKQWALMSVFFPKNTAQGTITGLMALHPKNEDITGSVLELDLTGDPNHLFHGLPTHFTWIADSASSGAYFNNSGPISVGNGMGAGTIDVHYIPGGSLRNRATGGGRVAIVIQGLVASAGVNGSIQVPTTH